MDLHVGEKLPPGGFVKQEQVDYPTFLANRFGRYYDAPTLFRQSPDVAALPEFNDAEPAG